MLGRTLLIIVTTALLVAATSCSSNGFDKGSNADVLLQAQDVTVPPVTASLDTVLMVCNFTITESTATLNNVPKTEGDMFSPANDVLITTLTISYAWDDGLVTSPFSTSPRITVPAGGSNQVDFLAIPLDDLLNAASPRDGHSAELTLLFDGITESGEAVQAIAGAALIINSCQ